MAKKNKPKLTRAQLYQAVMERSGLVCGICGESLEDEWLELLLWREHKHTKRTRIDIDLEHVIPKSKIQYEDNWWSDLNNLQLTHRSCNKKKGDNMPNKEQWGRLKNVLDVGK